MRLKTILVADTHQTTLVTAMGKQVEVLMVPLTNIGRWYRDDQEKETVRNSDAYPYATWLDYIESE